ncbi:hypothetical protein EYF80_014426 [Liparis tanakae]|uniref:Uncharacterized protein n=1 Tax=Liparis tanakae TaxID=230148 RepID=A0A4Z2IBC5_9TELE|nr:hypothetical protein EYF80_014426 [Liparis tanakae]
MDCGMEFGKWRSFMIKERCAGVKVKQSRSAGSILPVPPADIIGHSIKHRKSTPGTESGGKTDAYLSRCSGTGPGCCAQAEAAGRASCNTLLLRLLADYPGWDFHGSGDEQFNGVCSVTPNNK